MNPFLDRLRSGQLHPLTIGLLSFVTTVAFVLAQPATGLA